MAHLVRRAARPLQQGANRWLQQASNQVQGPAVAVAVAGGEMKSWTAAGMARFLAANPAASTSASSDPGLLRILRSEIEHERGDYKQPARLARGPPKPWTLTDSPGKQEIILRRSYGQEDIAVTAVYQTSEEPEANDEEDADGDGDGDGDAVAQNVSHLTVTVSKGGDEPAIEFSLTVYDGTFVVDHISYLEEKDSKETSHYDGPPYHELDEELRNQFDDYLNARGIDDNLTRYLKDLLPDKERREYLRWLRNIETFVRK